jgi:hypothetical protein
MIKFSWKKINDKLDWQAFSVLEYFFIKRGIRVPGYLRPRQPLKVCKQAVLPFPKGDCFVLNIDEVLQGATDPNHLYLYLELASKRNVFDYAIRGMRYLPLVYVDEHRKVWVEQNPLLEVVGDKVYFKYE